MISNKKVVVENKTLIDVPETVESDPPLLVKKMWSSFASATISFSFGATLGFKMKIILVVVNSQQLIFLESGYNL